MSTHTFIFHLKGEAIQPSKPLLGRKVQDSAKNSTFFYLKPAIAAQSLMGAAQVGFAGCHWFQRVKIP
jgi:hypothetical protein